VARGRDAFSDTRHMKRCFHGYTGCGRTGKRVQPVGRPRPTDWFMGRLVAVGVGLNFAYCPPRPVVGAPSSSRRTRSNPPPWYPAAGGRSLMPAGWLCEWGFTPFPLLPRGGTTPALGDGGGGGHYGQRWAPKPLTWVSGHH